jgi:hypothetical protein
MAQFDDEIEMMFKKQNQQGSTGVSGDAELDAMLSAQESIGKPKKDTGAIQVSNEESEIGALDRLAVKNFGGSIPEQVDFLKKRNPGLEIKEYQGEIIAKKPQDPVWKKLDPSGVTSAKEAFLDLGDIGYDVLSGAGSSVAGAAGAVPGALFGFGAGGLATGAAASGAASAGLETVKQAIGKALGTRKQFEGKDIAISGALGGITTGLLGAGASKKLIEQAASKPKVVENTLKKIMETVPADLADETKKQMTKELIEEGQKGVLGGFAKNVLSKWSGIPKEELVKATNLVPAKTIQNLADSGLNLNTAKKYTNLELADVLEREGMQELGDVAIQNVIPVINRAKQETSTALKNAFSASDQVETLQKFSEPLRALRDKIQTRAAETGTDVYESQIKELDKYLGYFGQEGQATPVKPDFIFDLKNQIADLVDYSKSPAAALKEGPVTKQLQGALKDTERQMATYLDDVLKDSDKGLRQQYKEHLDYSRYLFPKFKDEDTAIKTVSNLDSLRSPTLRRVIDKFENKYKEADIIPLADLSSTWRYFGRPAKEPIGGGGSVKVLRGGGVGASLGYLGGLLSGIPGGGAAGAAIGGGLGSLASSPAAIKGVLQAETAAARGLGAVGNQLKAAQISDFISQQTQRLPMPEYTQSALSKQAAGQSIWNLMRGEK